MAERSKYKMEKLTVPNWNLFNEKKPKNDENTAQKTLKSKK